MPSTTPLGALPIPLDADPFADGAGTVRQLAAALDRIRRVKSTPQTVNNSTVLVDEPELQFNVEAGKKYVYELRLVVSSGSGSPDFRFVMSTPAGSTSTWFVQGLDTATTTAIGSANEPGFVAATNSTAAVVGVPNGVVGIVISGSVIAGSAGTVKLRWAQNVATAADLRINAGSVLVVDVAS